MTLTDTIIALGGVTREVTVLADPTAADYVSAPAISKESVLIRLLPVADYPKLFTVADDELALAELLCARPPGWGARLPAPSLMEIVETGMDLNFPSACRWAKRRASAKEAAEELQQILAQQLAKSLEALSSASPSPSVAPPPRSAP